MQHEHSLSSGTDYLAVVKDVGLAVGCQLIWCKELKGPMCFTCIITIEDGLTFWTLIVQTKSLIDGNIPTDLILFQLRSCQYLKTRINGPWS